MFSKYVGEITKKDITLLTISGLISLILWEYVSPFTPTLIYYGDATYTTIQNAGFKQITDVTIEFDPNQKLTINYINHTKLSGEIITNYTNHDQKIYHISHMYPKDRVFLAPHGPTPLKIGGCLKMSRKSFSLDRRTLVAAAKTTFGSLCIAKVAAKQSFSCIIMRSVSDFIVPPVLGP